MGNGFVILLFFPASCSSSLWLQWLDSAAVISVFTPHVFSVTGFRRLRWFEVAPQAICAATFTGWEREDCEMEKQRVHMSNMSKCVSSPLLCRNFPRTSNQNETGKPMEMRRRDQAYDRPRSSLVLCIVHFISMLQWILLPEGALCLCLSVCKPHWPCWMRIPLDGVWQVVYRLVLSPFTRRFSARISEDSSSSVAPGDVLWQGVREKAAKWIQGWAKRSFQRRLQRERKKGGRGRGRHH